MRDLLVSPEWLAERLSTPGIKVVDGSWYLPAQNRDAAAEYAAGHIPGAVFLDLDAISDQSSSLPHMMPDPESFAASARALGLSERDTIVVYDGIGLFSAPRIWWMLRTFGAADVRVLDGGLPAWRAAGLPLEQGKATPAPARFDARLAADAVADADAVQEALQAGDAAVLDARPAARFSGELAEPRPGVASGHMPGALNLPFDRIAGPDGRMRSPDELRRLFAEAGLNMHRPAITSCGSGVTAAVLNLALATLGKHDVRLYDGSWAEWGSSPERPVVKGLA